YEVPAEAGDHDEDGGYQFADGVNEVVANNRGRLVDEMPHLEQLDRSLGQLAIRWPMRQAALRLVMRELIRRNALREGTVYLQITRGVAPRDHAFPKPEVAPALVMTTKGAKRVPTDVISRGVGVITIPDIRWKRSDIRPVGPTANVQGKQKAKVAGAFEAWHVNERGEVTEGTSTNAWIVTREGRVVTHPPGPAILSGVTRLAMLRLAAESQ